MYKTFILYLFLLVSSNFTVEACTTFLVSGKYTVDGCPLLYKHRDTGEPNNALVKFNDGKYLYVGLVNATSDFNKEVWGGYNEKGFAIMNSAAYTNNVGDTTKLVDQEGVIMKKALQYCATIHDFENLLDTLSKPLGADANFGVIDAFGGAAYYETGNFKYVKVDANDPLLAPDGFIVRSNHSFSGDIDEGYGFIRYQTAYSVLYEAVATKQFSPKYLLNNMSRNLSHSLTGENMEDNLPVSDENDDFRFFIDYIPRSSSASAILIVGTPDGENPKRTMMWSIIGFPLTTIVVPVWLRQNIELPKVVSMLNNGHSYICDAALGLKNKCFPFERGSGKKYINLSVVENKKGTGFLQKIRLAEEPIFEKIIQLEKSEDIPDVDEINKFYGWIDEYISEFYNRF